ncbi:hypothetical protein DWV00_13080 [Trinickia dinghuensis]|uniref:Uncharacterized protein n=1 Tax=Trinickia dinghuensis TaxID=2291023 RepID=A0A3D8K0X0_9BURK|nr:hypothetical protein DWV00_13080 [Trinickia dinghuensis]
MGPAASRTRCMNDTPRALVRARQAVVKMGAGYNTGRRGDGPVKKRADPAQCGSAAEGRLSVADSRLQMNGRHRPANKIDY